MKYPKEVKPYLKVLDKYEETDELEEFDSFHLYDAGLAYPNGYYDARNFILVGYNETRHQKRNLGKHDGLIFEKNISPKIMRIFVDGSNFINFNHEVTVHISQAVIVERKK